MQTWFAIHFITGKYTNFLWLKVLCVCKTWFGDLKVEDLIALQVNYGISIDAISEYFILVQRCYPRKTAQGLGRCRLVFHSSMKKQDREDPDERKLTVYVCTLLLMYRKIILISCIIEYNNRLVVNPFTVVVLSKVERIH